MGEREKQYSGKISYKKLFEMMEKRGINKRQLRDTYNLSPTLVNRLVKNENVAVDTIMYLCEILNCQPKNIVEWERDPDAIPLSKRLADKVKNNSSETLEE